MYVAVLDFIWLPSLISSIDVDYFLTAEITTHNGK